MAAIDEVRAVVAASGRSWADLSSGERLAALLTTQGREIRELSFDVRVSERTLRGWLRETKSPRDMAAYERVCGILGVTLQDVLGRGELAAAV